jgi:beta-glucosidase
MTMTILKTTPLALALALAMPAMAAPLTDWPRPKSAIGKDAALEARVAAMVAQMTLAQKIGQMTQPEIKAATPADVKRYYLGSVLNGGGSWPNGNKRAGAAEWLALAEQYHAASMDTDMAFKVPVIWGIDAVHGNNNVAGATLFPHNIGLGAAHDPKLAGEVAAATGRAVRATGIAWVFGPTVAVVRDDRWGRTYESFSEDPLLVKRYAGPYVTGLQGRFRDDANVVASIKHFLGDGGTGQGKDRGVTSVGAREMMNVHAQGYYAGLAAGAQTVMVSFNSWNDTDAGVDHGKLHGSKHAVTDILKNKLGFDGFVVSDWNGIAEVPGCRNDSCAQAVNAGIDMFMVPDDWKSFIANTTKQVEAGEIPMARIDDAVTRILRVKLRAGLFTQRPAQNVHAGKDEALRARELARRAVRQSLVLLKNEGPGLPLKRGSRILVVGKSADNLSNQSGGWSLTWQGTANTNADFPHADSILAGIRAAAGAGKVHYSLDGRDVDVADYDAVVAVIGETPYAEGDGDIGPSGTLRHSSRHPEDLAVLEAVAGKGKPVITVFVAGRPLWVNDLLNLSNTFVAAWLPGTEGKGVSDLLVAGPKRHDFSGRLSFSWPASVCHTSLNVGDANYAPLFKVGYGLRANSRSALGRLDAAYPAGGCGTSNSFPVFGQADRASFPLAIRSGAQAMPLGADLNATIALPGVSVQTSQINTQQDAKQITWSGPASIEARGARTLVLPPAAAKDGALRFDTIVTAAPAGKVTLAMACAAGCGTPLDVTALFKRLAGRGKQVVSVPLACFSARGVDLSRVEAPFVLASEGAFTAAVTNIEIAGGGALAPDAARCEELQ